MSTHTNIQRNLDLLNDIYGLATSIDNDGIDPIAKIQVDVSEKLVMLGNDKVTYLLGLNCEQGTASIFAIMKSHPEYNNVNSADYFEDMRDISAAEIKMHLQVDSKKVTHYDYGIPHVKTVPAYTSGHPDDAYDAYDVEYDNHDDYGDLMSITFVAEQAEFSGQEAFRRVLTQAASLLDNKSMEVAISLDAEPDHFDVGNTNFESNLKVIVMDLEKMLPAINKKSSNILEPSF